MRIPKIKKENKQALIFIIPLFIILIPIVIVLSPYFIIDGFLSDRKRNKRVKDFLAINKGKYFFFYSSKHNWHNFVNNNIIPALPKEVSIYNIYREKSNPLYTINDILDLSKISWDVRQLPLIVKIEEQIPIVYSMKNDFRDKKENGKRDIEIQKEIEIKIKERFSK